MLLAEYHFHRRGNFVKCAPFSATTEGFGVNHTGSKWAKIEQQGWDNASRGMPEVIEDSGGGCVYDTDQQLVSAMDQLLEKRSYRDELGQRGFKACQRLWTVESHLEQYFALIDQIGRQKRSGN